MNSFVNQHGKRVRISNCDVAAFNGIEGTVHRVLKAHGSSVAWIKLDSWPEDVDADRPFEEDDEGGRGNHYKFDAVDCELIEEDKPVEDSVPAPEVDKVPALEAVPEAKVKKEKKKKPEAE